MICLSHTVTRQQTATASNLPIYNIFVPQNVLLSRISHDVTECDLWFGPSSIKNPGYVQARSQDLEKGGGYFERVRSVQTTLTRIFIDLESVSDGLFEIWDEMSRKDRKFKRFFRPKLGDLQKKKKRSSPKFRVIFRPKSKIQRFFPTKIRWSPKKKKKVFAKIQGDFSSKISQVQAFVGGLFSHGGGYFPFCTENRPQKHKKHAILHTSQPNGGGSSPPPPPPLATLLATSMFQSIVLGRQVGRWQLRVVSRPGLFRSGSSLRLTNCRA